MRLKVIYGLPGPQHFALLFANVAIHALYLHCKLNRNLSPKNFLIDSMCFFLFIFLVFLYNSFAPWCPACQQVGPVWSKLALKADELGINVGEVDTTIEPGKVTVCSSVFFTFYQNKVDYSQQFLAAVFKTNEIVNLWCFASAAPCFEIHSGNLENS